MATPLNNSGLVPLLVRGSGGLFSVLFNLPKLTGVGGYSLSMCFVVDGRLVVREEPDVIVV